MSGVGNPLQGRTGKNNLKSVHDYGRPYMYRWLFFDFMELACGLYDRIFPYACNNIPCPRAE